MYNTNRLLLQPFENSSPFSSTKWWDSKNVDDVNVSNVRLWKGCDSWCSHFQQENILQLLHIEQHMLWVANHIFYKARNERLVLQIYIHLYSTRAWNASLQAHSVASTISFQDFFGILVSFFSSMTLFWIRLCNAPIKKRTKSKISCYIRV